MYDNFYDIFFIFRRWSIFGQPLGIENYKVQKFDDSS